MMRLRYRRIVVGRMLVCPLDPGAEKVAHRLPVGGRCHPDSGPRIAAFIPRDRIGAALAIQAAPDPGGPGVRTDRDPRLPLAWASLPGSSLRKPRACLSLVLPNAGICRGTVGY